MRVRPGTIVWAHETEYPQLTLARKQMPLGVQIRTFRPTRNPLANTSTSVIALSAVSYGTRFFRVQTTIVLRWRGSSRPLVRRYWHDLQEAACVNFHRGHRARPLCHRGKRSRRGMVQVKSAPPVSVLLVTHPQVRRLWTQPMPAPTSCTIVWSHIPNMPKVS